MDVLAPALSVLALVVLVALCCACCRRTRYSGRVLAPGDVGLARGGVVTSTTTYVQAPYPQQQYTAPGPVVSYPVGQSAPYPTQQWGGGMPLPAMSPAPPPPLVPTAPLGDALPPSYEQVVSGEGMKHPPYNPNYPH